MTMALEGGEWSAACPRRTLPPGKTWYPLYRRLRGSQYRSEQVRKISPPLGFDPRTVQRVASRYTDYATRPILFLTADRNVHHFQRDLSEDDGRTVYEVHKPPLFDIRIN